MRPATPPADLQPNVGVKVALQSLPAPTCCSSELRTQHTALSGLVFRQSYGLRKSRPKYDSWIETGQALARGLCSTACKDDGMLAVVGQHRRQDSSRQDRYIVKQVRRLGGRTAQLCCRLPTSRVPQLCCGCKSAAPSLPGSLPPQPQASCLHPTGPHAAPLGRHKLGSPQNSFSCAAPWRWRPGLPSQ